MASRVPYKDGALWHDLQRVREAWAQAKRSHSRRAVYIYLRAVFELVMVWKTEGRAVQRATRALRNRGWEGGHSVEPFNAIIACTGPKGESSRKDRSKYARVLIFAADHKPPDVSLEAFVLRNGGISACAALLS